MSTTFEYTFPAIRGIQAGREYYITMCPLRLIPKIFLFDEEELSPEVRAQRILNRARIPEIARYIVNNQQDYVFSAITASIDGQVKFEAIDSQDKEITKNGMLKINMNAKFIINDGQHRRAAIEQAIKLEPQLGDESIAVVFFLDKGLHRSQQMFSDLNRHAIRPSRSLGLLYDHRNDMAKLAKLLAISSDAFKDLVEMERSTLSERSRKLFTLSAIYTGCQSLLDLIETDSFEDAYQISEGYWNEVAQQFHDWELVRKSEVSSGEIRRDKIHSHGIALQCLGQLGSFLLDQNKKDWKSKLIDLKNIDWSRNNAGIWEGRALVGGRVSKTTTNVILTTNFIKQFLKLKLTPDEQRIEDLYLRGSNGK
ncbi:MAG: DNA sulfur modification protein DndB [Methylophilaceae bacterium]|nr:DNA sulfur modification protein DndB [Methylophilaceae bacterium]